MGVLILLVLTSCAESEPITFPFILSTANDYPLLKYSTKSCTVSTLCPDVYCEHNSSGANEDLCEFSSVLGYDFSGDRMYYIRYPIYKYDISTYENVCLADDLFRVQYISLVDNTLYFSQFDFVFLIKITPL